MDKNSPMKISQKNLKKFEKNLRINVRVSMLSSMEYLNRINIEEMIQNEIVLFNSIMVEINFHLSFMIN